MLAPPTAQVERVGATSPFASLVVTGANAPSAVKFDTYDGSGEVVHPDVVSFTSPWNGHRLWTTLTPYPNSATLLENPSIFASDDGQSWRVPTGATNPLARTSRGHLSDPDMVFDPDANELRMYYREVQFGAVKHAKAPHIADNVFMATSHDGVNWTSPRLIMSDTGRYVVSPSFIRSANGQWRMFAVDAGTGGCSAKSTKVVERTSQDGLTWGKPTSSGLSQPGYVAWHLDVQYVAARGEYWALTAAYPSGRGCMATSLFLATSRDGRTWTTYPSPVLAPSDVPAFSSAVYRSTFAVTSADSVSLWFSGARLMKAAKKKKPAVFAWSAATSRMSVDSLFARVLTRRTTSSAAPPPNTVGAVLSASVP